MHTSSNNSNDLKYLNYPLQKINCRSLVDSYGCINANLYNNATSTNLTGIVQSSKKVPIYIRYCIDLILGEVGEGDLTILNKKYKYVKDLPLLIAHFNLACKCATNLVNDFEYFSAKTRDTRIKCEFDFKKYIIII